MCVENVLLRTSWLDRLKQQSVGFLRIGLCVQRHIAWQLQDTFFCSESDLVDFISSGNHSIISSIVRGVAEVKKDGEEYFINTKGEKVEIK